MYKVIVADDEHLMREAMKRMIEMVEDFEVCAVAETGIEAVEACRKWDADIIFLDVIMPDQNGIEAGKIIRTFNQKIAIYLISAYNEFDFAKEAIRIQVAEYLVKPLGFTTVKRVLEEFRGLNRKRDQTFRSICGQIDQRNYKEMYYHLPDMVESILKESWNNEGEIVDYYYQIETRLIERYDCAEITSYINKPAGRKPPMEKWLGFRLYATMDIVFRHLAGLDYPVMEKAFAFIDSHVEENIGLREVREDCGLSQGYLSRIFKKTMHISVMEYIHLCRMMQAKWLFCTEGLSVTDAAYRLGYNESSYFSKLFKKYEHMTVSEYKKTMVYNEKPKKFM